MTSNIWFLALFFTYLISLHRHLKNHGKDQNEKYNFWMALVATIAFSFVLYKAVETGF